VRALFLSLSLSLSFSFVLFSSGGECGGAFLRREDIASPPEHAVRRLHAFVFVARPHGGSSPASHHAVAAPPDGVLARSGGEGLLALPGWDLGLRDLFLWFVLSLSLPLPLCIVVLTVRVVCPCSAEEVHD